MWSKKCWRSAPYLYSVPNRFGYTATKYKLKVMNYDNMLPQPVPEVATNFNAQPTHQDQQSIIASWLKQQPKILTDQDGNRINYADTIIALRKKKFGAWIRNNNPLHISMISGTSFWTLKLVAGSWKNKSKKPKNFFTKKQRIHYLILIRELPSP